MPATRARSKAGGKPTAEERTSTLPAEGTGTPDEGQQALPEQPNGEQSAEEEPEAVLLDTEAARGEDTTRWVPFAGLLAHRPYLRAAKLTLEEWEHELEHFLEPGKFAEAEAENTDDGQEA